MLKKNKADTGPRVISRGARIVGWSTALAAAVAAAAGVGTALVAENASDEHEISSSAPSFVTVGTGRTDRRQPATLRIAWADPIEVASGSASGRVTALDLSGDLAAGGPVLELDGIVRPALIGTTPLWRPLSPGAEGDDVHAVAQLLADLDYAVDPAATEVDDSFVGAVEEFEAGMGWPRTGEFKPDYVIWIPPAAAHVGEVLIQLGDNIGEDTPIFRAAPSIESSTIEPASPEPVSPEVGALVFAIANGITVQVSSDLAADPTDLSAAASRLAQLGEDGLPAELQGVLRLSDQTDLQTVPSSAIIVGPGGDTCLVIEPDVVVAVHILGGRDGLTELEPTLDANIRVLSNPSESAALECVSR